MSPAMISAMLDGASLRQPSLHLIPSSFTTTLAGGTKSKIAGDLINDHVENNGDNDNVNRSIADSDHLKQSDPHHSRRGHPTHPTSQLFGWGKKKEVETPKFDPNLPDIADPAQAVLLNQASKEREKALELVAQLRGQYVAPEAKKFGQGVKLAAKFDQPYICMPTRRIRRGSGSGKVNVNGGDGNAASVGGKSNVASVSEENDPEMAAEQEEEKTFGEGDGDSEADGKNGADFRHHHEYLCMPRVKVTTFLEATDNFNFRNPVPSRMAKQFLPTFGNTNALINVPTTNPHKPNSNRSTSTSFMSAAETDQLESEERQFKRFQHTATQISSTPDVITDAAKMRLLRMHENREQNVKDQLHENAGNTNHTASPTNSSFDMVNAEVPILQRNETSAVGSEPQAGLPMTCYKVRATEPKRGDFGLGPKIGLAQIPSEKGGRITVGVEGTAGREVGILGEHK